MQNRILDRYMDDLKTQLRHLPLAEQRQVLGDVRAHLEDDIAGRRSEHEGLSVDEAVLQATHGFGDPHDIGVAYGANGGVVRKSTGEVLLHVAVLTGRGVARTVGKTLKWTGIVALVVVGILLVVGLVGVLVATDLLKEYKDEIVESVPRPVYSYSGAWSLPDAQTTTRTDTFQVSTDARGFDLTFDLVPQSGCLAVLVTSPSGQAVYQNGQGCSATRQQLHFSDQGSWRIQYTFAAFTGSASAQAYEYLESNDAS